MITSSTFMDAPMVLTLFVIHSKTIYQFIAFMQVQTKRTIAL